MNNDELRRFLDAYLEPSGEPNTEMAGVRVVRERDHPGFGARHMWDKHRVSETEVQEVLFEVPPHVESKRHPGFPNRSIFWGATGRKRWLFVVCEDWRENGVRFLRPITAFEPDDGVAYWEKYA